MYRLKCYSQSQILLKVMIVLTLSEMRKHIDYCYKVYGSDIMFSCEVIY